MTINENNIEALIVDYIDGNLTEKQSVLLKNAIEQNNYYKTLLNEYTKAFEDKIDDNHHTNLENNFTDSLKHTSDFDFNDIAYFDRLAILNLEGIATETEKKTFNRLVLQNNQNLNNATLYAKCKIKDDKQLEFSSKQLLKVHQNTIVKKLIYYVAASAAILIICCLLTISNNKQFTINQSYTSTQLADNFIGKTAKSTLLNTHKSPAITTKAKSTTSFNKLSTETEPTTLVQTSIKQDTTLNNDINIIYHLNTKIEQHNTTIKAIATNENVCNNGYINIDLIGQNNAFNFYQTKRKFVNRFKKGRKPQICVSHNNEGKKDEITLLIGNREVRIWAR